MKTYNIIDSSWECDAVIKAENLFEALRLWREMFSGLEDEDLPDSIEELE